MRRSESSLHLSRKRDCFFVRVIRSSSVSVVAGVLEDREGRERSSC